MSVSNERAHIFGFHKNKFRASLGISGSRVLKINWLNIQKTFDNKCTDTFKCSIWTCVSWSLIYVLLYLPTIYTQLTIALRNLGFLLKNVEKPGTVWSLCSSHLILYSILWYWTPIYIRFEESFGAFDSTQYSKENFKTCLYMISVCVPRCRDAIHSHPNIPISYSYNWSQPSWGLRYFFLFFFSF